jgi:MFS family permease
VPLLDPDLLRSKMFRLGITGQMLQQIALGGSMIVVPIFLQMVLEYDAMQTGLTLAPLSLTMFIVAMLAGKRAEGRRPAGIIRLGFGLLALGILVMIPIVPRTDTGWWLALPLFIMGLGLGLLVSQLNNYALAPISEERVSEAAGVNSAAGSFGLSFGLAFAGGIMLATLSFTFVSMAESSEILPPAERERVATVLEEDAQVMSNTQLEELLAAQPEEIAEEIVRINTESRPRALQAALLVPLLAAVIGFVNGFRMMKLPDVKPSADIEGMTLGG